MKSPIIKIGILLLLFGPKLLPAQSLDSLIVLAIAQNLDLQILQKECLAAFEKAPQVSQRPDPEIGLGIYPLPVETRLGAQLTRLSVTQMLPWFGTLDKRKELELAKAKALHERIGSKSLDISYAIKTNWYELYRLEKSQSIIQGKLQILQALERLALTKIENGQGSAADVLRVQMKTEALQQQLKVLKATEIAPKAAINQLLNRETTQPLYISDSLSFAPLPFYKDSLLALIQSTHPMLRMYDLQQEISQRAIAFNTLKSKPSFGAGLDYILVNRRKDADPTHNGRDILQVKASLKIPLNRQQYKAKEREERIKIVTLDLKKSNTLSQFELAIEQAYAAHEQARLKQELYQRQLELTTAIISILEGEYSAKGQRFDELLQIEQERIDYHLQLLEAIVQSHMAKSRIERFINQ